MPLCSSFAKSPLWDSVIWQAFNALGNPGETIHSVIAAKRVSDNANFGIFCTDQAMYLLRSEFACQRIAWESVAIFAQGFQINQVIELILGKTTHLQRTSEGEIETIRQSFYVSQNTKGEIEQFFAFCRQKMSEFLVHSERIEVLPNIKPQFQWRVFSGSIQLIHQTDIPIESPTEAERAKMNSILRERIDQLIPKFAEIERTYSFNTEGWRVWGDPENQIELAQLVNGSSFPNSNLSEEDLSFVELMNANLEGSDLSKCNLQFTDLAHANLRNANLSDVHLRGAILFKCDLEGANLSGADLSWSTLSEANLKGANLRGCDLRSSLMSETILRNADLSQTKLGFISPQRPVRKGRKVRRFPLAPSDDIIGTFLAGADLSFANMTGASLDAQRCVFSDVYGRNAIFYQTLLPNGVVTSERPDSPIWKPHR